MRKPWFKASVTSVKGNAISTNRVAKTPYWLLWLNNGLSWLVLVVACVLLVAGGYQIYQRMTQAQINHIHIQGVDDSAQHMLSQYLTPDLEGNYFSTDLEQVRDKVLKLSWVDRVVVSRQWPDQLNLHITQRHPVARWGSERFLSDDGIVFKAVANNTVGAMPLLHGPVSQAHTMMIRYRDISQMFYPLHLKELYLTDRLTWFIKFDNGLRIVVDQDQTMNKLQRLEGLAKNQLSAVWGQVEAVDLRYRNGFALQWKNGQVPKMHNGHFVVDAIDQSTPAKP